MAPLDVNPSGLPQNIQLFTPPPSPFQQQAADALSALAAGGAPGGSSPMVNPQALANALQAYQKRNPSADPYSGILPNAQMGDVSIAGI